MQLKTVGDMHQSTERLQNGSVHVGLSASSSLRVTLVGTLYKSIYIVFMLQLAEYQT